MSAGLFKGVGIIVSYLWLLLAIYLFEWEPFTVFFAHILEFLVIILIFGVVDFRKNNTIAAQAKRPTQNIVLMGLIFSAFQLFAVGMVVSRITEDFHFFEDPWRAFDMNALIMGLMILAVYLVRLFILRRNNKVHEIVEQNVIYQALALVGMNIAGIILVFLVGDSGVMIILTGAIVARVVLEFYFNKKIRLI